MIATCNVKQLCMALPESCTPAAVACTVALRWLDGWLLLLWSCEAQRQRAMARLADHLKLISHQDQQRVSEGKPKRRARCMFRHPQTIHFIKAKCLICCLVPAKNKFRRVCCNRLASTLRSSSVTQIDFSSSLIRTSCCDRACSGHAQLYLLLC